MKENNKIIRIIVERSTARLIALFLSVINISITQQIGNTQFTNISSIYPNPVPLAKASPVSTLIIPLKRKAKNKQPNESIFRSFGFYGRPVRHGGVQSRPVGDVRHILGDLERGGAGEERRGHRKTPQGGRRRRRRRA